MTDEQTDQETPQEDVETPQEDVETPQEEDTFPRSYVEELRAEAAEHRVRAKDLEASLEPLQAALRTLAIEHYAKSVLADTSALEWSDELAGDDGLPDGDKIRKAAEELVNRRPSLGRPQGDPLLGAHGDTAQGFSWSVLSGLV